MAGLALGKKVALATMGSFLGGGTGKSLHQYITNSTEMLKIRQNDKIETRDA